MSAFLWANVANYTGKSREFALDCFGGDTNCGCDLSSCCLWVLADESYNLLLSLRQVFSDIFSDIFGDIFGDIGCL